MFMVRIKRKSKVQQDPFLESGKWPSYKDVATLSNFLRARGGISSRYYSRLSAKSQRIIARQIKRARYLGLLPFVNKV